MDLRKIIRPHQPDKAHARIARAQRCNRLRRISCAQMGLDVRHVHVRMPHQITRIRHTLSQRCRPLRLQRIAGRDKPPDPVQPEPLQRLARDVHMPRMRRIKRSAQQTNALARSGNGKAVSCHEG